MINKLLQKLGLQPEGYAIWWLSQDDCEILESMIDYETQYEVGSYYPNVVISLHIPLYIAKEYRSRLGRAGRGRLWVPPEINITECVWSGELSVCQRAAECGGIVVHMRDWQKLRNLPGFITDIEMRYLKV